MGEEKKCCCKKLIFVLLLINTLLVAGIFFKLYASCGSGSGFCALKKKGSGYNCPYSQKGSAKGSGSSMDMKGSSAQ